MKNIIYALEGPKEITSYPNPTLRKCHPAAIQNMQDFKIFFKMFRNRLTSVGATFFSFGKSFAPIVVKHLAKTKLSEYSSIFAE